MKRQQRKRFSPRREGREVLAGVILLAALGACRAAPERATKNGSPVPATRVQEEPAADETASESAPDIKAKMNGHYDDAQTMRRAITIGDIGTLQSAARHLASDRWLPALSSEWAAPLAEVRAAARRASEVASVEAGAAALAALGTACAACHEKMGGPSKSMALSPPAGTEEPSMLSHQAAVDELWAGLITPDAEAWQRGARSLAAGSFAATSAGAEQAARELGALARQSVDAPSGQREELLARSLSTCARCHQLHGVGTVKDSAGMP